MQLRANESGQAIALFAIALLLVGLMTFFTIGTGNRIQEKVKAQAAADSAAYGLAVAQARSMNIMALANRAIIGEYVSALSVAGHISWMNNYEWTFKQQHDFWFNTLKADVHADCALFQACHPVWVGGRLVPGPKPGWCAGYWRDCRPYSFPCSDANCLVKACRVPDALFNQIADGWETAWAPASYDSIHQRWQGQPGAKLDVLRDVAADWVKEAYDARVQGQRAYREYYDLIASSQRSDRFTYGVGQAIDTRMKDAAVMTGAKENLQSAIQVYPSPDPRNPNLTPGADQIRRADFDVFNEILTGTRGSGQTNLHGDNCTAGDNQKCWQTRHGWGPGYFEGDSTRTQSTCNQYQGLFPGNPLSCPTSWDDPNFGGDLYPPPGLNGDQGGAGSQMMMQGPFSTSQVIKVNSGNAHLYDDGNGLGMGGQTALSATDVDYTTAGFFIDQIGPCGSVGNCQAPGTRTGVCHIHTLPRTDVYYQKTDGFSPGCSSYTGPNGNVISKGNCPNDDTEVGFFRFAINYDGNSATGVTTSAKDQFDATNIFNQPFTYAATELDATVDDNGNHLPWDFQFGRIGGSMLTLKQGKDEAGNARTNNRDGTSFTGNSAGFDTRSYRYVRGFASGLTYYHNPGNWREVPNLFNPYWRATLAPPGANALDSLGAISPDDRSVGKELGYQ